MQLFLTLCFVAALLTKTPVLAYALPLGPSLSDTLPTQQNPPLSLNRYRIGAAVANTSAPASRPFTMSIRANTLQPTHEIHLPPGYNQKTVRIRVGDRTLVLDEDYVFIPDQNLIRILDEETLQSDKPIQITFERLVYHPSN